MASPSSRSASVGCKAESTWGTPVTPDRFWPVIPGDFITADQATLKSNAAISDYAYLETGQSVLGSLNASGNVGFEVTDNAIGLLLKLVMGGVNTSGAGPYTHVFTYGALPSSTWQYAQTSSAGTVYPITAYGCKVTSASLAASLGEIVTLSLDMSAKNVSAGSRSVTDGVTTNADATITSASAAWTQADVGRPISGTNIPTGATIASVTSATSAELSANATGAGTGVTFTIGKTLASVSYPSSTTLVTFAHGALSLGGTEVAAVQDVTVNWENGLAVDRGRLGSRFIAEQLESDRRSATASITAEFDDLTHYNVYRAGTDLALSLAFTVGSYSLTIAGNTRLTNVKQAGSGMSILEKSIECEFLRTAAGADSTAMTVTLVNNDSTP
jgi:hypothetical protein